MTKNQAIKVVKQWCKDNNILLTNKPMHVHPRSYIIGYAAPQCIIASECWHDSEEQVKNFVKKNPLQIIRKFDSSLQNGDFCITAYICTISYSETIAVSIDYLEKNNPKI